MTTIDCDGLILARRQLPLADKYGFREHAGLLREYIAACERGDEEEQWRLNDRLNMTGDAFAKWLVQNSNETAQEYLETIDGLDLGDGKMICFTGEYKNGQKIFQMHKPSLLSRLRARAKRRA
jgi:hypothetical protein